MHKVVDITAIILEQFEVKVLKLIVEVFQSLKGHQHRYAGGWFLDFLSQVYSESCYLAAITPASAPSCKNLIVIFLSFLVED